MEFFRSSNLSLFLHLCILFTCLSFKSTMFSSLFCPSVHVESFNNRSIHHWSNVDLRMPSFLFCQCKRFERKCNRHLKRNHRLECCQSTSRVIHPRLTSFVFKSAVQTKVKLIYMYFHVKYKSDIRTSALLNAFLDLWIHQSRRKHLF